MRRGRTAGAPWTTPTRRRDRLLIQPENESTALSQTMTKPRMLFVISAVLLAILQVIDILIHVIAKQVSWQHIAANVAMIVSTALLMALVKKQVRKKFFTLAAVVGLLAYIIFIVIFLVMSQTPRGTVFWVLFAGTIVLWLLSLVFGFKSSEKQANDFASDFASGA